MFGRICFRAKTPTTPSLSWSISLFLSLSLSNSTDYFPVDEMHDIDDVIDSVLSHSFQSSLPLLSFSLKIAYHLIWLLHHISLLLSIRYFILSVLFFCDRFKISPNHRRYSSSEISLSPFAEVRLRDILSIFGTLLLYLSLFFLSIQFFSFANGHFMEIINPIGSLSLSLSLSLSPLWIVPFSRIWRNR